MKTSIPVPWKEKLVSPQKVLEHIEAGMNIFIGTGAAEPRTMVKHLMGSDTLKMHDLTLVQLVSFGGTISLKNLRSQKYRLKTFYSGWVASEAIAAGRVDLIPSRVSEIPRLIYKRYIPIDVALIQISEPNEGGYCSLGVAVDVARQAIEQAAIAVGEINTDIPATSGDTYVHMSEFDYLVGSTEPPFYFPRWPVDPVFDRVAANVASVIDDRSCLAFTFGPLFESLSKHLSQRRHLGIHTPFFTDALMDLVKSGAVSNRFKKTYRGKSVTSYAQGSTELYRWLDRNPLVEFQSIDTVFSPMEIGRNPNFISVIPARKVDLSGSIALHFGKGAVTTGPGQIMDIFNGAEISPGGATIFALPSRNREGAPNIRMSIESFPNRFNLPDSVDMVVTDYGIASLSGRSLRERAQALIEIAHPDDRFTLVDQAKQAKILYEDQIFLAESAHLYPSEIRIRHTFKGGISVRFRAIKPSDEEEMRRLFYRFSDQSVYYRYFAPIKTMSHAKMQAYVNVDFGRVMSIVGLAGEKGQEHIIAEARYVLEAGTQFADTAFIVDEAYQSMGIATYIFQMMIRLAKERGIKGFKSDVLASNKGMLKVFEKGGEVVNSKLEFNVYNLTIPFKG
ncbi:MAG: GNAT family N-acetyltransferase [Deltaproteobacteria bacterium]|nr:GNAT family N-acetyltransferase [Deltaproteobacteria bacterium]